jgi:hypothetical protein
MLTQEELDKQTEGLMDPELKKLQEEEKRAAKSRQVKQDEDDATRHDRLMDLRKSIYKYGFSQKQLQAIFEEKFSARDFSVLKTLD